MNVTSISLSYVFIGIGIAALIAFIYFKVVTVKSSPESESRDKIVGNMKNPDVWRSRNNALAYLSLTWAIISTAIFIYIKYYMAPILMPGWYVFAYAGILAISYAFFGVKREKAA